jgi:hypothetical protein
MNFLNWPDCFFTNITANADYRIIMGEKGWEKVNGQKGENKTENEREKTAQYVVSKKIK